MPSTESSAWAAYVLGPSASRIVDVEDPHGEQISRVAYVASKEFQVQ
jgi:hypothetical protein